MENKISLYQSIQIALHFMPPGMLENTVANKAMRQKRMKELLVIAKEFQSLANQSTPD